jgi:hypothetical protein
MPVLEELVNYIKYYIELYLCDWPTYWWRYLANSPKYFCFPYILWSEMKIRRLFFKIHNYLHNIERS